MSPLGQCQRQHGKVNAAGTWHGKGLHADIQGSDGRGQVHLHSRPVILCEFSGAAVAQGWAYRLVCSIARQDVSHLYELLD